MDPLGDHFQCTVQLGVRNHVARVSDGRERETVVLSTSTQSDSLVGVFMRVHALVFIALAAAAAVGTAQSPSVVVTLTDANFEHLTQAATGERRARWKAATSRAGAL